MKSLVSVAFGAGLVVAICAAPAAAADLPMVTKAPVAAPVFSWTGCYLGANLGYGWGRASATTTGGGFTGSASENLNGVVGGGQIGCNYQWTSIVWGIEGDFQGTSQRHSDTFTVGGVTANTTDRVPWFGTIRGRLGWAVNNWLFYGTGGWGYGEFKSDTTFTGAVVGTISTSRDHGFWVVGGGIENAFAPHWSWKLEYLYLSTGNLTNTSAIGATVFTTTSKFTDNIVRAGVNYRF
jgi:outer membrane immunogenic protein